MSLGSTFEPKRLIGIPSGPIRNLVKFYLIVLINTPFNLCFKYLYRGSAFDPSTSLFLDIGKVTL